jgi:hypothetical protein
MANRLITTNYSINNAKSFLDSFNSSGESSVSGDNRYYFFVGYSNRVGSTPPVPNDDTYDTLSDAYRNMLFGKKIANTDVSLCIPRYDYTANSVYAQYDDRDPLLFTKAFFVNNGGNIFKCLFNNSNNASTVPPDVAQIDINDEIFITSDGYVWKYMYSIDSGSNTKFTTSQYLPVVPNSSVIAVSVPGSIDVVSVDSGGSGYSNYIASGTFKVFSDYVGGTIPLNLTGSPTYYGITGGVATPNFYVGCYIHITGSTASSPSVGQYRKIIASSTTGSTVYVQLQSAFNPVPDNTCSFEIYPSVDIVGDSTETITAVAIAVINASSSNTISRVKMLERGKDYKYATATVNAPIIVSQQPGFSAASVRPILPPRGGHGANPYEELGAKYVGVSVTLANSEANSIIANNTYSQYGILKDPLFANVSLNVNNKIGTFAPAENIYKFKPYALSGTITTQTGNSVIVGFGTSFNKSYAAGDYIYITNSSNTIYQFAKVSSVTNSVYLTLNTGATFTDSLGIYGESDVVSTGVVVSQALNNIVVTNTYGTFATSDQVIGLTTGAVATVNSVSRSNQTKGFQTFVQMFSYDGTLTSGTFIADEQVVPSDNQYANATFHSLVDYGTYKRIYLTDQTGAITAGGGYLLGQTSGAKFTMSNKYYPELVYGSGQVLYIENIDPITRKSDQSENFKLILEF